MCLRLEKRYWNQKYSSSEAKGRYYAHILGYCDVSYPLSHHTPEALNCVDWGKMVEVAR